MAKTPSAQELANKHWSNANGNLSRALSDLNHENLWELSDQDRRDVIREADQLIRAMAEQKD